MTKNKKIKYGVFIIESMDFENENQKKLDGLTLKTILDLCDIPNMYFYIRTKLELEQVIKIFNESNFGFLHIACHGNESALGLTCENIDFEELELIIGYYLHKKRLFLSACKAARFELAQRFIPKYHCYSVIGSPDNIDYDKAAVFWSSFYYMMYEINKVNMTQKDLWPILVNVTRSFKIKLNYFSIIKNTNSKSKNHLKEFHYESGNLVLERLRQTEFNNIFRE